MRDTIVIEKKNIYRRRGGQNIEKYVSNEEETVENMV